jgi:hypothetical protein
MKVTVIMEKANDGSFSCYMQDQFPDFGLIGSGDTAKEAQDDLIEAYNEIREDFTLKGKNIPDLEFEFKYDLQSFFDYFYMLNQTKLAEAAGINPSLLRRYVSGTATASQKQYDRLQKAVKKIGKDLAQASF